MPAPTLQDGIDQAGSPVALLWKSNAAPFLPPVVESEYVGWRQEQTAWHEAVAISDLSFHMSDTFFEGPDVTRLLEAVSANNYRSFAVGQAKQFVPVTSRGFIITDGILMRNGEEAYSLTGAPSAQNWVKYHAETGGYDVTFETDPDSRQRGGADPRLFRYQIQGPLAQELVERAFGGPLPATKFFHSSPVTLAGRTFRALRHGMAGQAGYEFIGQWADAAAVKDALMAAGEPLGLAHVGALAYTTANVESGWIPSPIPAVYTDPDLADYRRWLPLFGIEGQRPLHGSFYSEDIEDYYVSPFELGYGRSISFDHDFIGRDALLKAKEQTTRRKVTVVLDPADVRRVLGEDVGYVLNHCRFRVEAGDALVGMTYQAASLHPAGTVLALAIVEERHAETGTPVEVVWGEHPGPGSAPLAAPDLPRIRATVAPAPYDQHARTEYRRDA
jgi:vanillate/3-O-methylgallate O-demethylase